MPPSQCKVVQPSGFHDPQHLGSDYQTVMVITRPFWPRYLLAVPSRIQFFSLVFLRIKSMVPFAIEVDRLEEYGKSVLQTARMQEVETPSEQPNNEYWLRNPTTKFCLTDVKLKLYPTQVYRTSCGDTNINSQRSVDDLKSRLEKSGSGVVWVDNPVLPAGGDFALSIPLEGASRLEV